MMQKNRLDHWIRKRFLFEYHVLCNGYPYLPIGATATRTVSPEEYRYRIVLPDEESYLDFSARLRKEQIAYVPVARRRETGWVRLIEPDENDSLTSKWTGRLVCLGLLLVLWINAPFKFFLRLSRALFTKT
jgi:hypothetical protein